MLTRMLNRNRIFIAALAFLLGAPIVNAQIPEFTYQGRLTDGGNPASATYEMQFRLFDTPDVGTGTQQGGPRNRLVQVTSGVFTVQLDFNPFDFNGSPRYLEIGIRPPGSPNPYTVLAPRQPITFSPYAIRSLAANGLSAACLNCVTSSQIQGVQGAQVTGEIPVASIPAGSGNYIQNTTTQQTGTNFNISGNGTAGSLNVNGAASLGGIAPPGSAPAGQGRIYFDTASNKVKISENSGAFVNLVGVSGVGGGGTTNYIPFWSAGTTLGDSVITQNANGVQLPNGVQLGAGMQGNSLSFGSPNGETGLSIAGATGRADVRFDGLTNNLRLFNGPAGGPPSNGISVSTTGGATITGTNGDGAVVTARRSVGDPFVVIDATTVAQNSVLAFRKNNFNRWLMYTDNSSESGGNAGSDFKLDAYNNAGGIANYLFVKRSNGFVGIGTATPVAKLEVRDGALAITNGAIRVTGAGVNTSTPVFVHVKTAANECGTTATIIDNTYTNNDPSAILIVTQNVGTINPNAPVAAGDIYLRYGDQDIGCSVFGGLNRWMIYSTTGNMPNGTRFNVMVIKP